MAKKISTDPIDMEVIKSYITEQTDLAFELSLLPILRDHKFTVTHGGTYKNPVIGIPRQFDIRATRFDAGRMIRLAIESKCIAAYSLEIRDRLRLFLCYPHDESKLNGTAGQKAKPLHPAYRASTRPAASYAIVIV